MRQLNCGKVRQFLLDNNGDIEFKFNQPSASHFEEVFERQIGSIRRVFDGILAEFGSVLNPESLTIFLYEASAIVNSRPLSCVNINDETLQPLPQIISLLEKHQSTSLLLDRLQKTIHITSITGDVSSTSQICSGLVESTSILSPFKSVQSGRF